MVFFFFFLISGTEGHEFQDHNEACSEVQHDVMQKRSVGHRAPQSLSTVPIPRDKAWKGSVNNIQRYEKVMQQLSHNSESVRFLIWIYVPTQALSDVRLGVGCIQTGQASKFCRPEILSVGF